MKQACTQGIYSVLFVLLAIAVAAKDVDYQVVSFLNSTDTSMAVVVDEKPYPLAVDNKSGCAILYTGTAPVAKDHYYYAKQKAGAIVEREAFTRPPVEKDQTPNEFYNRSRNAWPITPLPNVLEPLPSIHRIQSDLHVGGEIPTIYLVGNKSGVDLMHTKVLDDIKVTLNMTYISPSDVQTLTDVELELAGRGSRWSPKLSYNIKIPKRQSLYGYRRLKLRSMATDPSYIREELAYKALKSVGVATTQSSYVRVFINDEIAGFFGIIENFQNPWLRNEFANGDRDYEQGILYQGLFMGNFVVQQSPISDLSYYGDNMTEYELGQYKIKQDPSSGPSDFRRLMELTKFLSEAPTDDPDAWKTHFDMESVLRAMAMEVLIGFSDGYMSTADNYYLYQEHPGSERFIYMPSDLDLTFGSTLIKLSDMLSGDYRTYPGLMMRPLTTKFLQVPAFKERFEYLIRTVSRQLVNLDVMGRTMDETVAMITQDVEWDMSLPKLGRFDYSQLFNDTSSDEFSVPPPVDNATVQDLFARSMNPVSFMQAVNGPTGHISLAGVKEFIAKGSRAIEVHYKQV